MSCIFWDLGVYRLTSPVLDPPQPSYHPHMICTHSAVLKSSLGQDWMWRQSWNGYYTHQSRDRFIHVCHPTDAHILFANCPRPERGLYHMRKWVCDHASGRHSRKLEIRSADSQFSRRGSHQGSNTPWTSPAKAVSVTLLGWQSSTRPRLCIAKHIIKVFPYLRLTSIRGIWNAYNMPNPLA